MDTNDFASDIPQVVQTAQSVLTSLVAFVTALLALIAIAGRAWHAWKSGNSVTAALVKGTNQPAPGAAPVASVPPKS